MNRPWFSPSSGSPTWQFLDIGGGGYVVGMEYVAANGSNGPGALVARCDSNGPWLWNGSKWLPIRTINSMPAGTVGFTAGTGVGASGGFIDAGGGCDAIAIAPSNTNIFYMSFDGLIWRSTNQGGTWVQISGGSSGLGQFTSDPNGQWRTSQQKMAIDPNNPAVVIVTNHNTSGTGGSGGNAFYYSTNATTANPASVTWTAITTVPAPLFNSAFPTSQPGGQIVFGDSNHIFILSNANDVYYTTGGPGGTFSALSCPMNAFECAVYDHTNNILYATAENTVTDAAYNGAICNHLISYTGLGATPTYSLVHTFGTHPSNACHAVSIDPNNASRIAISTFGGGIYKSEDSGATWAGQYLFNLSGTGDVTWLGTTSANVSCGTIIWLDSSHLMMGAGVGVWNITGLPNNNTTPTITYNSQTVGIEQLVSANIIGPPCLYPIVDVWDQQQFTVTNPTVFPTAQSAASPGFAAGLSMDYAKSDPTYIAAWDYSNIGNTDVSGYSHDSGITWTGFANVPTAPLATPCPRGCIAASTPTNLVFASGGNSGSTPVTYTTNNGTTAWQLATGVPNGSYQGANEGTMRILCADPAGNGTFYLLPDGTHLYRSTNGGANWSLLVTQTVDALGNYENTMQVMPGQSGILFYGAGNHAGGSYPTTQAFYYMTGATGVSPTWNTFPGVEEVWANGFGAIAPGFTYPSIWIAGFVNKGGGYQWGIWRTPDFIGAQSSAASWERLIDYPFGYPERINTISGDPHSYSKAYVGFPSGGFAYGYNLI